MEKTYTTFQIAEMCGVRPTTIISWVKQKRIPAFVTPGGHRRVRHDDLMAFLRKHKIPMPAALTSGTFSVLVVENEDDLSQSIQASLSAQNGYKVSAARDGISALLAVGRDRPDLMILDIRIPGVDGLEVCRQIKSDPKSHTAVIAIGGPSDGAETATAAGADAFLPRPVDLEVLLSQVKKLLQVM